MCTVTFIPTGGDNFILTSNRDEAIERKTLPPDFYKINKTKMLFPKDAVAGGTWIGVSDKNTMICLLNGGFEKHLRLTNYVKSRGVVVKDLLEAVDVKKTIESYELSGVEPFTIIAVNWSSDLLALELVWDGSKKYIRNLGHKTYIWSSSTLYTKEVKEKRIDWFREFEEKNELTKENMLSFHKSRGNVKDGVNLWIDRGQLKTRSITQVFKNDEVVSMRYEDLLENEVNSVIFESVIV
ncbi:hypothetical protein HN014_11650 [Aquimarina sp. TRL1]|uniref:NRDE family protein n=1 Tax=Aquimarina sp. (strain TRL1) TaxID=2736252 RepID=UPI00158F2FD0|nr:NRDE family protein [Aquimarina sp. TRL1]QKX05541.1 hypothetical protein HN014_11650 [Aquimarina sp. TRL1]